MTWGGKETRIANRSFDAIDLGRPNQAVVAAKCMKSLGLTTRASGLPSTQKPKSELHASRSAIASMRRRIQRQYAQIVVNGAVNVGDSWCSLLPTLLLQVLRILQSHMLLASTIASLRRRI